MDLLGVVKQEVQELRSWWFTFDFLTSDLQTSWSDRLIRAWLAAAVRTVACDFYSCQPIIVLMCVHGVCQHLG